MIELDPGKTAWPFHYHLANEEAIYILDGEAMLRLGAERRHVRAGDYIALPVGPADAHQLTNTGSTPVRYLVISTMVTPDVGVYPDANKVGVVGGLEDADGKPQRVVTFPRTAEVDYWEGETTTLDGSEPEPATEAKPAEDEADREADREAKIEQMADAELEALKRKLDLETMVDSDLDALKRKLDGDG